jgi:hypothetical protein
MITALRRSVGRTLRSLRGLRAEDYRSAGLADLPQDLEVFFPHVEHTWPMNAAVPHITRQDRRFPGVGWLTIDEAVLMYNYGLQLPGKNVLEIGCWVGWSTVVWGLSGAVMTVVDPVLDGAPQGDACRDSLRRAGLIDRIRLIPGFSPAAVKPLMNEARAWNGFFIDGDHEGDAPLCDVQTCSRGAAADCLIVLHDAIQPNIANALSWLKENGWECGVHYTSQFLGVAWRGKMTPLRHIPDPRVNWEKLLRTRFSFLRDFQRI